MGKYDSQIKTADELYIEANKFYQGRFNSLNDEQRLLGALGDCICTIREATLYLNEYRNIIPPMLANVMKKRIKKQKELAVGYYKDLTRENR